MLYANQLLWKGVVIILEINKIEPKEKEAFPEGEKHPLVCCMPKIECTDVGVKVKKVEHTNLCHPDETVLRYKICNFGPGVATRICLKSFICPEPFKVCVKDHKKLTHFTYKNGIFKAWLACLKPCECFEFEIVLKECKLQEECHENKKKFYDCNFGFETKKPPRKYDVTSVIEAKEEDLNICNNVDIVCSREC